MEDKKSTRALPLSTIVAIVALLIIAYWFLFGDMYGFYGSVLFLFYSWTKSMWISVVMLGIFQTLLLIPFRIIRLLDFKNIRDFKERTVGLEDTRSQESFMKQQMQKGNWTLSFYLVDFAVQLTTYMTMGRLFLTDFYNKALNPEVLYSFVPYPDYPIQDRFFKIPYLDVSRTTDLGMETVIYFWLNILVIELIIAIVRGSIKARRKQKEDKQTTTENSRFSGKYMIVYGAILFIISYLLLRNFPVAWELKIFTGDVAKPNRAFNTVTAIATFLTIMWFGVNDILKKSRIARNAGVPKLTIEQTQMSLFKDKITSATLIGLGAYFITNQIPCAFELSIFTLEVISLSSPFTLDRMILKNLPQKDHHQTEPSESEKPPASTDHS